MEALTAKSVSFADVSAIKQGVAAVVQAARKGIEVERQSRQVIIHSFELLEFSSTPGKPFGTLQRGTYVRTLADDLGKLLGCVPV